MVVPKYVTAAVTGAPVAAPAAAPDGDEGEEGATGAEGEENAPAAAASIEDGKEFVRVQLTLVSLEGVAADRNMLAPPPADDAAPAEPAAEDNPKEEKVRAMLGWGALRL